MLDISTIAMPRTLTQTITVIETIPKTRAPLHGPIPEALRTTDTTHHDSIFAPALSKITLFFASALSKLTLFFSHPYWEALLRLTIFLLTSLTASNNFLYIAGYINHSFQRWLDVAPIAPRSWKARILFWFMTAVYLATLVNVGILLLEQLSQFIYLAEAERREHIGLFGPKSLGQLSAATGVLVVHWLLSELTKDAVSCRYREEAPERKVVRRQRLGWQLIIWGLGLVISEFCCWILGYKGAFALATDVVLLKAEEWAAFLDEVVEVVSQGA